MYILQSLSKLKYEEAILKYNLKYLQQTQLKSSTRNHVVMFFQACWRTLDHGSSTTDSDDSQISISRAKENLLQSRRQVNRELDELCQDENKLPEHQRLTPRMIFLLEQRFANIHANLACINRYKIELFRITNPRIY